MAYIPRSSFIPKEASGAVPMQIRKRRTVHVFGFLGTTLLILALCGVGGTYFYNGILEKRLESAKSDLNAISQADTEQKIEEIQTYDTKLNIAKNLLENHIATSRIFAELEDSTKKTIQFESLNFTYDPGFEATLELSGNTEEFSSVALQKMQFFGDSLFSDFVVQGITTATEAVDEKGTIKQDTTSKEGKVSFDVKGLFRKGVLEYTGMARVTQVETEVISSSEVIQEGTEGIDPTTISQTLP